MKGVVLIFLALFLVSSCTPKRFAFEYPDSSPVETRTRVEAQSVSNWDIHRGEPGALLILGTVFSTVAGVVTTPVWGVKNLIWNRGTPDSEEAMRQRVYDRHLSSWLFGGYLWAPLDFDVISRQQYLGNTVVRPRETRMALPVSRPQSLQPAISHHDPLNALLKQSPRVPENQKNWLFAAGVETYDHTSAIAASRRTTSRFAGVAIKRLGVSPSNITLLTDDGVSLMPELKGRTHINTAASFKDQLRYQLQNVKENDRLYVYFSGHGLPALADDNHPYLLLRDQSPDFIHTDPFFRLENFLSLLGESRASEIIVFLDSCFTGVADGASVFGSQRAATRLVPKPPRFDGKRLVVISAGSRTQFSNLHPDYNYRLFSFVLMEELMTNHPSILSLFDRTRAKTKEISSRMGGTRRQEPTLQGNAGLKL